MTGRLGGPGAGAPGVGQGIVAVAIAVALALCAPLAPSRPATAASATATAATTASATPGTAGTAGPRDGANSRPSVEVDTADGALLNHVAAQLRRDRAALADAKQVLTHLRAVADATAAAAATAANRLQVAAADEQAALMAVQAAQARVRALAVSAYVAGGSATPLSALVASGSLADYSLRRTLITTITSNEVDALRRYDAARRAASSKLVAAVAALDRARSAADVAGRAVPAAAAAVANEQAGVALDQQLFDAVHGALAAPGTDIPNLVLDAYRRASATVTAQGCPLPWSVLAAIGKVESNHARAEHATLAANGDVTPPIIGLALDGTNGTALVRATDGGRWTGDPVYAHAVGPMQLLPSTWAVVGRDGNGDGVADPNNVYDAAASAARYLCLASAPLGVGSEAGLHQAIFSYNHSDDYVTAVMALAQLYASLAGH